MSLGSQALTPVAVFGGTFDPIHHGHLRSAVELADALNFTQVRMMPCGLPPHRNMPEASAEHRAAMVELAVAADPVLICDRRELEREGVSYTIDSLAELRAEVGERQSLSLIMGCDAVQSLDKWHRWQELLNLAHVVVIARPGWVLPKAGPVASWLEHNVSDDVQQLQQRSCGQVFIQNLRPLPISASEIRNLVSQGAPARFLLPEAVLGYLLEHSLYA